MRQSRRVEKDAMLNTSVTGSVGATNYLTPGVAVMVIGEVEVDSPAILGTLNITFRWTESSAAKTHVESLLLTVLGNKRPWVFPVHTDVGTTCTYECALAGLSGGFAATMSCCEVNI